MSERRMIVTGATGFVGRNLIAALHDEYRIWAVSRGSPALRGAPLPANVSWRPADIAVREDLRHLFAEIRDAGGAEILVHLAGHYDFSGEANPAYEQTNVLGMRNVLDEAKKLGVRQLIFSSSVAACDFPPPGERLDEASPPDGTMPYSRSKGAGERMLAEYADAFDFWIVRFAALYSDWCEYEPLYRFVETWLSRSPRRRLLGGRGDSAIPYLHIRDAVALLRLILTRRGRSSPGKTLLGSPDGAVSHRQLFEAATAAQFGQRESPVSVPRALCIPALHVRQLIGRATGHHAFERPWMGRMIDLRLEVDSGRTRKRLGWSPNPRLGILRRMPFLIQNRKAQRLEWDRRNHERLRSVHRHENLDVHRMLRRKIDEIGRALSEDRVASLRTDRIPPMRRVGPQRRRDEPRMLLEALAESMRTGEKEVFQLACRRLARLRRAEHEGVEELVALLGALNDRCLRALAPLEADARSSLRLHDHVTMTVQFGIDEVLDVADDGA